MSGNQQQQQEKPQQLPIQDNKPQQLQKSLIAEGPDTATAKYKGVGCTLANDLIQINKFEKIVNKTKATGNSNTTRTSSQPKVSLLSATPHSLAKGTAISEQSHQLQTVATIHQQHSKLNQQQQYTPGIASRLPVQQQQQQQLSCNSKELGADSELPATRRSLHQLQPHQHQLGSLKISDLTSFGNSIPPRYQPPPQPESGGVILKPNLALKFPPNISHLSGLYISDCSKQKQQQKQQQQQSRQYQHPSCKLQRDMLKFVRKQDQDHPSPSASVTSSVATGIPTTNGGRLTVEQNRQFQSLVNELHALKEQNQRLLDDNQELRDLCCFLDDDRQKGRKLAREWQRFGRYTASVMRQEVATYQNKLRQLDDKQQELITDNLELKELCLYLDEERAHVAANVLCAGCGASTRNALRDDGDGSSSSTNAEDTITTLRNYADQRQLPDLRNAHTLNDQTLQYVRSLERRIQQLEEERTTPTVNLTKPPTSTALKIATPQKLVPSPQHTAQDVNPLMAATTGTTLSDPIAGRPEAVVRALQVLEVREQLERDRLSNLSGCALDQMDDGEKAIVREMCNVVWRKLEGSPQEPSALDSL